MDYIVETIAAIIVFGLTANGFYWFFNRRDPPRGNRTNFPQSFDEYAKQKEENLRLWQAFKEEERKKRDNVINWGFARRTNDEKDFNFGAASALAVLGLAAASYGAYTVLNRRTESEDDDYYDDDRINRNVKTKDDYNHDDRINRNVQTKDDYYDDDRINRNAFWGEVTQPERKSLSYIRQEAGEQVGLYLFTKKEKKNPKSVLNDVTSKYAIKKEDTKERVKIITEFVEETLMQRVKDVDKLFKFLYKKIDFTGSYYGGLRCTRADEFDLNILLNLSELEKSLHFDLAEPGFVKVRLASGTLSSQKPDWIEHWKIFLSTLTEKDFSGETYYLSPKKIRSWFQRILDLSKIEMLYREDVKYVTIKQSGPARTLRIDTTWSEYPIDVDLVPTFRISLKNFDLNQLNNFPWEYNLSCDNFFIIPKEVRGNDPNSWRLDFHDLEKKIVATEGFSKNVIKLLKVFRSVNQELRLLSSYSLKTLVMLMIRKKCFDWSPNNLPELFIQALEYLKDQLEIGRIPYFFDHSCDVLWSINMEERKKMSKFLLKVIPKLKDSMNQLTCREVWSPYFDLPTTRSY